MRCPTCKGSGKIPSQSCKACGRRFTNDRPAMYCRRGDCITERQRDRQRKYARRKRKEARQMTTWAKISAQRIASINAARDAEYKEMMRSIRKARKLSLSLKKEPTNSP
jgi:DnaJ-class molecular chaperone